MSVGPGSGAVFFSGCPLRCCYCQNAPISMGFAGEDIDFERLVCIFLELQNRSGAANINLVTPTQYVSWIVPAVAEARRRGLHVPVVYNTSGYERAQVIRGLAGTVDIYLADFKYAPDGASDAARAYSAAPDYHDEAIAALDEMVSQVGGAPLYREYRAPAPDGARSADAGPTAAAPVVGAGADALASMDTAAPVAGPVCESGSIAASGLVEAPSLLCEPVMARGVIVRHLLLPGRLDDSKRVIGELWSRYGDAVKYSFMSQYTPMRAFPLHPELDRPTDPREYEALLDYADALGIDDYFWQEGDAVGESFVPLWDGAGVLEAGDPDVNRAG